MSDQCAELGNSVNTLSGDRKSITKAKEAIHKNDLTKKTQEYRQLAKKQQKTTADAERMRKLENEITHDSKSLQETQETIARTDKQAMQQATKTNLKPGGTNKKTAVSDAIDDLNKGDTESAIRKLAKSDTHNGDEIFEGNELSKYKDTSISRINRLKNTNGGDIPSGLDDMIEQMKRERKTYSRNELAKKGDDYKKIALKASTDKELTEAERLKLWNSDTETRQLAKDALDDVNGNKLIKGLKDDALASGDSTRIRKLSDEMKRELDDCIKRRDCGGVSGVTSTSGKLLSEMGMSLGTAGLLLGAGLELAKIQNADGRLFEFDKTNNILIEMDTSSVPKFATGISRVRKQTRYGEKLIDSDIENIWNALRDARLFDKRATEGNTPGVQLNDANEFLCQEFQIEGTEIAERAKTTHQNVLAVTILGEAEDKRPISHALIAIEMKDKPMGTFFNQITGKNETAYKTILIDPQTGETSKGGWDLTGDVGMEHKETKYKIEALTTFKNPTQVEYEVGTGTSVTTTGNDVKFYETEEQTPQLDKITTDMNDTHRIDGYGRVINETTTVIRR